MKIVIVMDGGLVQDILSDKECNVVIVDYDTDGVDEKDLTAIEQRDGKFENAYLTRFEVEINKNRTKYFHKIGLRKED
jgi:hypothetical protein